MSGTPLALIPFAALVAFLYYVVARAEITRWFWEGYLQAPPEFIPAPDGRPEAHTHPIRAYFDALLSCAMCSGFWIGLALGWAFDLPVPAWHAHLGPYAGFGLAFSFGGIYGLVLNPIVMGAMYALRFGEAQSAYNEQAGAMNEAQRDAVLNATEMHRSAFTGMGIIAPEYPPETVSPRGPATVSHLRPLSTEETGGEPLPPKGV